MEIHQQMTCVLCWPTSSAKDKPIVGEDENCEVFRTSFTHGDGRISQNRLPADGEGAGRLMSSNCDMVHDTEEQAQTLAKSGAVFKYLSLRQPCLEADANWGRVTLCHWATPRCGI